MQTTFSSWPFCIPAYDGLQFSEPPEAEWVAIFGQHLFLTDICAHRLKSPKDSSSKMLQIRVGKPVFRHTRLAHVQYFVILKACFYHPKADNTYMYVQY